jgi:LPS export ABC transporter protein LptC
MITKGAKLVILAILAVSLIFLSFLMESQIRNVRERTGPSEGFVSPADIALTDLTVYQTRKGSVEWQIQARSAEWFEREHRVDLSRARAEMHSEPGRTIRFAGDRGAIDTRSYDFTLANDGEDLRVDLGDGYSIMTRSLEWSNRDGEVHSDHPVRILGPEFTADGKGFRFNAGKEELTLRGGVDVRFSR